MSTLSLSIIALIAVVLVIVIAHNLWQAHRRNQHDPVASLRKGRFDHDPDTLTGQSSSAEGGRDRREPVLGDGGRPRIPPSLAARPAQVDAYDDGPDALRAARGEGNHPSLALDDEDFIETPFENPAAVRPWSSSEKPKAAALPPQRDAHEGARHAGLGVQDRQGVAGAPHEYGGSEGVRARSLSAADDHHASDPSSGTQAGVIHATPGTGAYVTSGMLPPARSAQGGEQGAASHEGADHGQAHTGGWEGAAQSHAAAPAESVQGGAPIASPAAEAAAAEAQGGAAQEAQASVEMIEAEPHNWPAAQVEHSIILEPPAPVNTDRLIALTSSLRHVGSKPVRIEVERLGGHWSTLAAGDKAVRMRCSLLLANRQGPLNAVELSDFNAAIEALAVQLQAPCEIADMAPILRQARDLDALAARLDTQIEIVVELSEAADPGRMAGLVRQHGLSERGNGRYEAFADSGDSLFSLVLSKNRDQINFLLDVPRTAEHHEAWQGMVGCASTFAQALGGRLIDSAGRGLSVGMIETVSRQLGRRYLELAQAGLEAGKPATLRVFH